MALSMHRKVGVCAKFDFAQHCQPIGYHFPDSGADVATSWEAAVVARMLCAIQDRQEFNLRVAAFGTFVVVPLVWMVALNRQQRVISVDGVAPAFELASNG